MNGNGNPAPCRWRPSSAASWICHRSTGSDGGRFESAAADWSARISPVRFKSRKEMSDFSKLDGRPLFLRIRFIHPSPPGGTWGERVSIKWNKRPPFRRKGKPRWRSLSSSDFPLLNRRHHHHYGRQQGGKFIPCVYERKKRKLMKNYRKYLAVQFHFCNLFLIFF